MIESHSSSSSYRCTKSATLSHGVIAGRGFALGDWLSVAGREIEFSFPLPAGSDLFFVFGVRGVGNHYRLNIQQKDGRFVLTRFRDGIPVYMQHAYHQWAEQDILRIQWDATSIRIFLNDVCFINVLNDGILDGRWGFAGTGKPIPLPKVRVDSNPAGSYQWIVLGDGYSNNRWKNRDFYSWPELAFGDKNDYLNACVAAGNTRRVLEIVEGIGGNFSGSRVIVAAGADDVIEGEPLQEIIGRLQQIITRIRELGASEVHLTTIVPQLKHDEQTLALNREIQQALSGACDSILDFHQLLGEDLAAWYANGDFPGAIYQRKIAVYVLEYFYGHGRLALLMDPSSRPQLRGLTARGIARLCKWLEGALGRF
jgi:hypothetical protein